MLRRGVVQSTRNNNANMQATRGRGCNVVFLEFRYFGHEEEEEEEEEEEKEE